MLNIRRYGFFLVAGLCVSLLVAGLPLDRLIPTVHAASYGTAIDGACNGTSTYQFRLKNDTPFYSDAALTKKVGVITVEGKSLQKFLACDESLNSETSVQISLAGSPFYVSRDSGSLAPRAAADNQ